MGRQVFTAGEILTAASMNDLGDQTVMVFDDATDRATAIPTPVEGMTTYLKDTDLVEVFDGSDFVPVAIEPDPPAILQVVSTTLTTVFTVSIALGGNEPITGLTATITPSSANSKIMVFAEVAGSRSSVGADNMYSLTRDGTKIRVGTDVGSRQPMSAGNASALIQSVAMSFLDNPATTSAVTYGVLIAHNSTGASTALVNRETGDADNIRTGRAASTITVMEVAG